jgi:hypothetical protein
MNLGKASRSKMKRLNARNQYRKRQKTSNNNNNKQTQRQSSERTQCCRKIETDKYEFAFQSHFTDRKVVASTVCSYTVCKATCVAALSISLV